MRSVNRLISKDDSAILNMVNQQIKKIQQNHKTRRGGASTRRTPRTPQRTTGTPQRTTGTPQRTTGTPQRTRFSRYKNVARILFVAGLLVLISKGAQNAAVQKFVENHTKSISEYFKTDTSTNESAFGKFMRSLQEYSTTLIGGVQSEITEKYNYMVENATLMLGNLNTSFSSLYEFVKKNFVPYEGCRSNGLWPTEPTNKNDYRQQSKTYHPDYNKKCEEAASRKMIWLNDKGEKFRKPAYMFKSRDDE